MAGEPKLMIGLRGHPLVKLADDSSEDESGTDSASTRSDGGDDHAGAPEAAGDGVGGEDQSPGPQPESPSEENQGEENSKDGSLGPNGDAGASERLFKKTFSNARDDADASRPAEDARGSLALPGVSSSVLSRELLALDMAAASTVGEPSISTSKSATTSEVEVAARSARSPRDGTVFTTEKRGNAHHSFKVNSVPSAMSETRQAARRFEESSLPNTIATCTPDSGASHSRTTQVQRL